MIYSLRFQRQLIQQYKIRQDIKMIVIQRRASFKIRPERSTSNIQQYKYLYVQLFEYSFLSSEQINFQQQDLQILSGKIFNVYNSINQSKMGCFSSSTLPITPSMKRMRTKQKVCTIYVLLGAAYQPDSLNVAFESLSNHFTLIFYYSLTQFLKDSQKKHIRFLLTLPNYYKILTSLSIDTQQIIIIDNQAIHCNEKIHYVKNIDEIYEHLNNCFKKVERVQNPKLVQGLLFLSNKTIINQPMNIRNQLQRQNIMRVSSISQFLEHYVYYMPKIVICDDFEIDAIINYIDQQNTQIIVYSSFKNKYFHQKVTNVVSRFDELPMLCRQILQKDELHCQQGHMNCNQVFIYNQGICNNTSIIQQSLKNANITAFFFKQLKDIRQRLILQQYITFLVAPTAKEKLLLLLKGTGIQYKVRILQVKTDFNNINPRNQSLSYTLKDTIASIKNGYYVRKSSAKIIDIIDKNVQTTKYLQVKRYLLESQIQWKQYKSILQYFEESLTFSEILLCSQLEKQQLNEKFKDINKSPKIIVFCESNYEYYLQHIQSKQQYVGHDFKTILGFLTNIRVFNLIRDQQTNLYFPQFWKQHKRITKNLSTRYTFVENNTKNLIPQFSIVSSVEQSQQINELIKNLGKLLTISFKPLQKWDYFLSVIRQRLSCFNLPSFLNSEKNGMTQYQYQQYYLQNVIQQFQKEMYSSMKDYQTIFRQILNKQISNQKIAQYTEINALVCFCFLALFNDVRSRQGSVYILQLQELSNGLSNQLKIGNKLVNQNFVIFSKNVGEPTNEKIKNNNQQSKIKYELQLQLGCQLKKYPFVLPYFFTEEQEKNMVLAPFTQFIITDIHQNKQNQSNNIIIKLNLNNGSSFLEKFMDVDQNLSNQIITKTPGNKLMMKLRRIKLLHYVIAEQNNNLNWFQLEKASVQYDRLLFFYEDQYGSSSEFIHQIKFQMLQLMLIRKSYSQAVTILKDIFQNKPSQALKIRCQRLILKQKGNASQQHWKCLNTIFEKISTQRSQQNSKHKQVLAQRQNQSNQKRISQQK